MKKFLVCALTLLVLTACQEDEEDVGDASSEGSQAVEPSGEDTTTADDGAGAMDGATTETQSSSSTEQSASSLSEVSQDAIDACIDGLRAEAGAVGGTVRSTEFSEANSLVMLQDENGSVWRCLVSNDGSSAELDLQERAETTEDPATADDGGGAMDGSSAQEAAPPAGSATDITDFVGARAGQAEGGLAALGFESIRSEGLTSFWFNRETGACARITTSDGVYSEIEMLPAEDC